MHKIYLFLSQTISTFLTTFHSHIVSCTEYSAALLTSAPPAVDTFKRGNYLKFYDEILGRNLHRMWPQFTYW